MKIKCEKCGANFDYDKYNGVCNKCGRYHSRYTTREALMRELESDAHHDNDKQQAESAQIVRTGNRGGLAAAIKKNLLSYILSAVAICLMIVVAMFYAGKVRIYKQIVQSNKEIGLLQPIDVAIGDFIPMECGAVSVSGCGYFHEWDDKLPAGYRLFAVYYQIERADSYYSAYDPDMYLYINDSFYLEALNEYRLAEEIDMDYEALQDTYQITNDLRRNEGTILFLVPAGVTSAKIVIYSYQKEGSRQIVPDRIVRMDADITDKQ